MPSRECLETVVRFEENYSVWFDWTGMSKPRQLFYSEPKRSHTDAFVNMHNEHATNLFGYNMNVICGCDDTLRQETRSPSQRSRG
jgi:hypothetical protein